MRHHLHLWFLLCLRQSPIVLSALLLFALSKPCSPGTGYFFKYPLVEEGGFEPPSKTRFSLLHTAITYFITSLQDPAIRCFFARYSFFISASVRSHSSLLEYFANSLCSGVAPKIVNDNTQTKAVFIFHFIQYPQLQLLHGGSLHDLRLFCYLLQVDVHLCFQYKHDSFRCPC